MRDLSGLISLPAPGASCGDRLRHSLDLDQRSLSMSIEVAKILPNDIPCVSEIVISCCRRLRYSLHQVTGDTAEDCGVGMWSSRRRGVGSNVPINRGSVIQNGEQVRNNKHPFDATRPFDSRIPFEKGSARVEGTQHSRWKLVTSLSKSIGGQMELWNTSTSLRAVRHSPKTQSEEQRFRSVHFSSSASPGTMDLTIPGVI